MDRDKAELRWRIEQRHEFIESCLFWEGNVSCIDVMQQIGVLANQASSDLNRYIALTPGKMTCDKSARIYVCGPDLDCELRPADAARYPTQFHVAADHVLEPEDLWIPDLPPCAPAPIAVRGVEPVTLRSVVGATRRSEAIEVKYQPLDSPEPRWRWIAPHAIAFYEFQRHIRAFRLTDDSFKGFLLARILDIRGSRESDTSAENDRDWNTEVTLEVGPTPSSPRRKRRSSRSTTGCMAARRRSRSGARSPTSHSDDSDSIPTRQPQSAGSADRAFKPSERLRDE